MLNVQSGDKGAPIESVNVTVYRDGTPIHSELTDENGDAIFQVEDGTYTIVVRRHLFRRIHRTKEKAVTITGDLSIIFTFLI